MVRFRGIFILLLLLLLLMGGGYSLLAHAQSEKLLAPIYYLLLDEGGGEFKLAQEVEVIDDSKTEFLLEVQTDIADETVLSMTQNLADTLEMGEVVSIPAGADDRFPLGLAGKVVGKTDNGNGSESLQLEKVTFADVVEESTVDFGSIALTPEDFVGVIAPSAVQSASPSSKFSSRFYKSGGKSFRNGAVTVIPASTRGLSEISAKLADDIDTEGGMISLDIKIDLANMGDGIQASTMQPVEGSGAVGFTISGALSNIKLTADHDFSKISGELKSMDFKIQSDLSFDVKFNGRGDANIGFFSQAWNEVEEETFSRLGVSAELSGLSSDDKVGRYPVAGLVWSAKCPQTCPVLTGQTQTPLRAAKPLGVILWVYLNVEGELSLDGELSLAKLPNSKLELGVEKPRNGDFRIVNSLQKINPTDRAFEAPRINGTLNTELTAGITTDIDFFVGGVRLANAGLDLVARANIGVMGEFSWGVDEFGQEWSARGNACLSSSIGAGLIAEAAIEAGIEVDTIWSQFSASFKYAFQSPSDAELLLPGTHGLWYRSMPSNICLPQPIVSNVSSLLSGNINNITITGTNLPDDLSILESGGRCENVQTLSFSPSQVMFSCTAISGEHSYVLSPDKAFNLLVSNPAQLEFAVETPVDIDSGLVAYYEFENNANDSSGNGYHGTSMGGIDFSESYATFDGIDDYIEITNSDFPSFSGSAPFTIATWVAPFQFPILPAPGEDPVFPDTQLTIFSKYNRFVDAEYSLFLGQDNRYGALREVSPYVISDNSGYPVYGFLFDHLVARYDGQEFSLFINGAKQAEVIMGPAGSSVSTPLIGASRESNVVTDYFEGVIENLRVYNRGLSDGEVKKLTSIYLNEIDAGGVVEDDYLPFRYSRGLSYNQISEELGEDGLYSSYRFATASEIVGLLENDEGFSSFPFFLFADFILSDTGCDFLLETCELRGFVESPESGNQAQLVSVITDESALDDQVITGETASKDSNNAADGAFLIRKSM